MNKKVYTLSNLRKGTGSTFGNFLRRMILVTDTASQVVAVKINNGEVNSMFVPIDNVVQDSMDIINNLTLLKFNSDEEYVKAYAEISEGTMTGKNLQNGNLTISNAESEILTTVGVANISIEIIVRKAQGSLTADQNSRDCKERFGSETEGYIFIDSYHSQASAHFTCEVNPDLTENVQLTVKTETEDVEQVIKNVIRETALMLKSL